MIKSFSKKTNVTFIFTIFLSILLVHGCGFHLRGSLPVLDKFKIIRLLPVDLADPFQRVLRLNLKALDVQLIEDPEQKATTITLLSQGFTEETLAYAVSGQASRSRMQFSFSYQLKDEKGEIREASRTVTVGREYGINTTAVLQTESDREALRQDLFNDAANQFLRQLATYKE